MLADSDKRLLKSGLQRWLADYYSLSAMLVPLFLLLRGYEFFLVHDRHGSPDGFMLLAMQALVYDVLVVALVLLFAGLLYLALRVLAGGRVAELAVVVGHSLVLLGYTALIEYFGQTRVPLGADLYGYTAADVAATVRTSSDFSPGEWLPFMLVMAIYWLSLPWRRLWQPSARWLPFCHVALLLPAVLCLLLYPRQEVITSEPQPALLANKLAAFTYSSLRYFTETRLQTPQYEQVISGYPLLHKAGYRNELGPYLQRAELAPNIVVIAIEGFGRAFAPGQRYGGFTPFFEQLTREGLYFPNFIATSGRSFGFLPSLIGSLPPAQSGFMGLGYNMPAHDTLISVLNSNDYLTNYFIGFSSNFDNIDVFLDRQPIDYMLSESQFGSDYDKMDAIEGGFTWGYADRDLYRRAFEYLETIGAEQSRLDIYHTVNLHEPFIIPDEARWDDAVEQRMEQLNLSNSQRHIVRQHRDIFAALLYSDSALEYLLDQYRQRDDFERTLFIITGDHRLIPIPEEDRLDRFSVPFLIWSPMVRQPVEFNAVSSHLDVVPSLLAYLQEDYALSFPERVHWLGQGIDFSRAFQSKRRAPLMRTKNELRDYLAGEYFLSGDSVFRLLPDMRLEAVNDHSLKEKLLEAFNRFKAINRYVTSNDKLKRTDSRDIAAVDAEWLAERQLLQKLGLTEATAEKIFNVARQAAFDRDYDTARMLGRHVLREYPNYHDVRTLLGRTYAWIGDYQRAHKYLNEVIRRNPHYMDAYSALADSQHWSGDASAGLETVMLGLQRAPSNSALLLKKVELLRILSRDIAALQAVNELLALAPENERAQELKHSIQQTLKQE